MSNLDMGKMASTPTVVPYADEAAIELAICSRQVSSLDLLRCGILFGLGRFSLDVGMSGSVADFDCSFSTGLRVS